MEHQIYNLVQDLSEEDIIDVLHEFSVDLEEDGYDSYDVLNQIIIETKLYEFIDCEFVLSEALNPRAVRAIRRHQNRVSALRTVATDQDSPSSLNIKKKGRFRKFLDRFKRFFSGGRSSSRSSAPRGPRYGTPYNRQRDEDEGDYSPRRSRQSSGGSRQRSSGSRQASGQASGGSIQRSSGSRQSSGGSRQRSSSRSSSTRTGKSLRLTPNRLMVVRSKSLKDKLNKKTTRLHQDEWKRGAPERIRQSIERVRQNPLAKTGSATATDTRERLVQRGLTQTPDSPGYKSKKGGTKKETKDAAVARAQAAGLSSRHIERIKSRFDQKAQEQSAQQAAQRAQRQAQRSQREKGAQKAARIRRAGQRPFRGTRPVQSNLSQRRQEVEARRTARYNQVNRILSPEAQQRAMASGVSPEKVGLSMKPDFSKTSKSGKPLKPYSPKSDEGTQRIMQAQRLSGEAGLQRPPETRQERQSRPREFSKKNQQQVTEMLLDLGYAPDYYSAIAILENLSDTFYNYLIEEYTYDSQY